MAATAREMAHAALLWRPPGALPAALPEADPGPLGLAHGGPGEPGPSRRSDLVPLAPAATARRVLVVDDEEQIGRSLARLLGRLDVSGLEVEVASDAASALARLEGARFDLVISDYRMPGEDGISLLAKVRERWPDSLRVLMTGYTEDRIRRDAEERAQVAAFVAKPWTNTALMETVARLLGGSDGGSLP